MAHPDPTSLILVSVMNSPRDMEIARLLGWYRIPLRSAPKVIAVDYLAFYQTSAFGDRGSRIEYLAPVRGHELVTRAELLRDEPNHPHAQKEYFKIQLGPLVQLARPVIATTWRRITFFYTTGDYLLNAETINDLVVDAEERALLWQSLRERANQAQGYLTNTSRDKNGGDSFELNATDLDPAILAALLGIKGAAS